MSNVHKAMIVYFCTRFHLFIHVYALILQGREISLFQIGTVESLVILTIFVMEIPTGVLADKMGHKWAVVASVFLLMFAELVFALSQGYVPLLVVSLLTGTGFAFNSGAMEALIYESLPEPGRDDTMKRTMGRYYALGQIAFTISPIVGGLLLADQLALRAPLAMSGTILTLAVGCAVSLTLKPTPRHPSAPDHNVLTLAREGFKSVMHNQTLRRLALFAVGTTVFNGLLINIFAPSWLNLQGVSPFWIGAALSAGSLLAAGVQSQAARIERWLGPNRALWLLSLLPGVGYLALSLLAGPGWAVWMLVVWMYGTNDSRAPLLSAAQNALIPSGQRATVLSFVNMLGSLYVALVGPLLGALAGRSLPLVFLVLAVMILAAGLVLRPPRAESVEAGAPVPDVST